MFVFFFTLNYEGDLRSLARREREFLILELFL